MNIKRLEKKFQKMIKEEYPYSDTFCDIVDYRKTYLCGEPDTTITVNYGTLKGEKVTSTYVIHLFYTGKRSYQFILGMFYQASLTEESNSYE